MSISARISVIWFIYNGICANNRRDDQSNFASIKVSQHFDFFCLNPEVVENWDFFCMCSFENFVVYDVVRSVLSKEWVKMFEADFLENRVEIGVDTGNFEGSGWLKILSNLYGDQKSSRRPKLASTW